MDKEQLKNSPIGIFDSGLGGLTVLRAIKRTLSDESIVYLGDTARLPYGTKSKESIIRFSMENAEFLIKKGVKLIVVACNTSSAVALPYLKERLTVPVFGVIEPGSKLSAKITKNGRIGIIGTTATIKSRTYVKKIKRFNSSVRVFTKACPLFVPFIEEGWLEHPVLEEVAHIYLDELRSKGIDTLVLGCTHYPLIKKLIKRVVGGDVRLIDSGEALSEEIKFYLKEKNLLAKNKNPFYHYYLTDKPQRFKEMAEMFLGDKITHIIKVRVEKER